ncbi:hypothetical protein LOK49_LG04G03183 [Camellia lanceoleosa]|uniref:Uncharacterized protein n=1 Tax=Camellia lanceoleosa TaxID=1840588 RepID=A0ACC0HVB7_9ERIC|nr:hypothetical protein LOK49_LG04G03183 [Camellia lanceoleosa]
MGTAAAQCPFSISAHFHGNSRVLLPKVDFSSFNFSSNGEISRLNFPDFTEVFICGGYGKSIQMSGTGASSGGSRWKRSRERKARGFSHVDRRKKWCEHGRAILFKPSVVASP